MSTAMITTAGRTEQVEAPAWNANWAQRAACRGLDLDFFFEDLQNGGRRGDPYAKAREICDDCASDVKRACLATSIAEGLRSGFFGGAIPARRIELRRAAQKAAVDVTDAKQVAEFLASR